MMKHLLFTAVPTMTWWIIDCQLWQQWYYGGRSIVVLLDSSVASRRDLSQDSDQL